MNEQRNSKKGVRVTTVAVEKQEGLLIPSVCF
jgi:hypothetical protein